MKSVQLQEGTAEAQLAAVGRGRTTTIVVPIPPTTGVRDVYLMFKNDNAKAESAADFALERDVWEMRAL